MQLVPAPRSPVPFFFSHWPLATAPLECESAVSKKGSSRAEPREAWRSTLSFLAPCPFFLFTQALKLSDTHLLFTGHGVCHCEQQTPTSSGVIDGKNIVNPSLRGAPATKQSHENDCTRIEALFRIFSFTSLTSFTSFNAAKQYTGHRPLPRSGPNINMQVRPRLHTTDRVNRKCRSLHERRSDDRRCITTPSPISLVPTRLLPS